MPHHLRLIAVLSIILVLATTSPLSADGENDWRTLKAESKRAKIDEIAQWSLDKVLAGKTKAETLFEVRLDVAVPRSHFVERSVEVLGAHPEHRLEQRSRSAGLLERLEQRFERGQKFLVGQQEVVHHVVVGDSEEHQHGGGRPTGAVLARGAME